MQIQDFFDGNGEISPAGWKALGDDRMITYPTGLLFGLNFPAKKILRSQYGLSGEPDSDTRLSMLEDRFTTAVMHHAVRPDVAAEAKVDELRAEFLAACVGTHKETKKYTRSLAEFEAALRAFADSQLQSSRIEALRSEPVTASRA